MNRRYYYFQLWEGFFKNKIIKKLGRLPSGDSIIVCYQRLIITTLNTDGWFYYEGIADSPIEELALELDINEETIKFTLAALLNVGLVVEDKENSAIRILIIPDVMRIGSEGDSAGRMRETRAKRKETIEMKPPDSAQCAHNVQTCAKDKEIEIHIEGEMIDEASSIITCYNEIFKDNQKLNGDNKAKVNKALTVITYGEAIKIIQNENRRYKNGECGTFYPSLGWIFGSGFGECKRRIEKQKKFNQFPKQDYGDMNELENELIAN